MTYSDIRLEQKLTYLRRLLNIRVRLMDFIDKVDVIRCDKTIRVVWYTKPEVIKKISFTEEIEFPIEHLSKRIQHYKRKVRTEFLNRHTETKKPKL
jgi:hypothetical protein